MFAPLAHPELFDFWCDPCSPLLHRMLLSALSVCSSPRETVSSQCDSRSYSRAWDQRGYQGSWNKAWRDKIAKISYPGRSPETADLAILAVVDPVWTVTTPSGIKIFEYQGHESLHSTPGEWHVKGRIQSPSRHGDTPLGKYLRFWPILSSQNDPCLGPQFQPPVWSVGGPISLCLSETRTYFQVMHLDGSPRFCLLSCDSLGLPWPGEPPVEITPILVILAS